MRDEQLTINDPSSPAYPYDARVTGGHITLCLRMPEAYLTGTSVNYSRHRYYRPRRSSAYDKNLSKDALMKRDGANVFSRATSLSSMDSGRLL